jgi:hypothetical protein
MTFTFAGRSALIIELCQIRITVGRQLLCDGVGRELGRTNDIVPGRRNRDLLEDEISAGMGSAVTRAGPAMLNRVGVV